MPLSVFCPDPGESWPCAVVPLLVNVSQYPQPTAARCYDLGLAIGSAIASFDSDKKIAIFGTGGMSHQLSGSRAGLINRSFDEMFLQAIETDPSQLTAMTREQYVQEAGSEGIELIMWLVMRGALGAIVRRVHSAYHVPVSNTAAGLALFDNRAGA